MGKKQHILIVDTETTQDSLVADFGAVLTDRKGRVLKTCAVLTNEIFTDSENHPLFYTSDIAGIWSKRGQDKRYANYNRMLESGVRMVASVAGINRWLDRIVSEYNPHLTAYNLPFDLDKCQNTGIDLNGLINRFCLWNASFAKWGRSKAYRNFVLKVHGFNTPTGAGNMSYKTNAEIMARFVLGNAMLPDEPHTALEDIIDYELPILTKLLRTEKLSDLEKSEAYHWSLVQVKDHYKAR